MAGFAMHREKETGSRSRVLTLAMTLCGLLMLASTLLTEVILALQGRFAEAIPMHLCSIASIAAMLVSIGARGMSLDFLWYLGMPGAMLALLFPAPAMSRWQMLFNMSYVATHMLILIIPALAMLGGDWPRRGRALWMMLLLQIIAMVAGIINRALGTDFLFLSAPPAQTPLVSIYRQGYGVYLLVLEGLMFALVLLMQAIRARIGPEPNVRRRAEWSRGA